MVNQNILESKYIDYANLIDKNLIATHCGMRLNRFKFIKASQHIGISFDIVYSILRDADKNDRDENYDKFLKIEQFISTITIYIFKIKILCFIILLYFIKIIKY